MAHLSKCNEVKKLLATSSNRYWRRVHYFFDFRVKHGVANKLEGLLRSLLLQLLEGDPALESELRKSSKKTYVPGYSSDWDGKSLREAFYGTIKSMSTNLCIFVDGLDECSEEMLELLRFLQGLPEKSENGCKLKVCLASRLQSDISYILQDYPHFLMQMYNYEGIKQYVSTTISDLPVHAKDKEILGLSCRNVAKEADRVFLWARFAVDEAIKAIAAGRDPDEIRQRLSKLPSNLENLYETIFTRMSQDDVQEARIMFQLVCAFKAGLSYSYFGHSNIYYGNHPELKIIKEHERHQESGFPSLLQLKEAMDVIKDEPTQLRQENMVDALNNFQRRLRAICGGLLEVVAFANKGRNGQLLEKGETSSKWVGESVRDDYRCRFCDDVSKRMSGASVKLIHRTVESYLVRIDWMSGCRIGSRFFGSPDALWLYICCRCIQSSWGSSCFRSESYFRSEVTESGEWVNALYKFPFKDSLIEYATQSLFDRARRIEYQYQESSYEYLSLVDPPLWLFVKDFCRLNFNNPLLRTKDMMLDWNRVDQSMKSQPWQIVVEQGLLLCCRDACSKGLYTPSKNGMDISLALGFAVLELMDSYNFFLGIHLLGRPREQLIQFLLQSGATVSQDNIVECLHIGTPRMLRMLLSTRPKRPILLHKNTLHVPVYLDDSQKDLNYQGENFGPLWELAKSNKFYYCSDKDYAENMLDVLIERGESLNEVCGPGGTILHAIIIHLQYEHFLGLSHLSMVQKLLRRGIDVNVSIHSVIYTYVLLVVEPYIFTLYYHTYFCCPLDSLFTFTFLTS